MIREVKLPEISENIDTAEVLSISVSQGDMVEEEQTIAEMETEKAVFEVPSPVKGKITEILIEKGQEVQVGDVIAKVDTEEGGDEEEKAKGTTEEEEKEEAEETEIEEGEKEGQEEGKGKEKEEEKAKEPKEEKEPQEIAERQKGKPKEAKEEEKDKKEPEETEPETETPEEEKAETEPAPSKEKPVPAAPSVRALARDLGVDIRDIPGSGPGGRISEEDVKAYTKEQVTRGPQMPMQQLPDFTQWGDVTREPMTKVRKITADNVAASWISIPQVTQFDQADVTEIENFRKKYAKTVESQGGKLTVTSILLTIMARALKVFPRFNASLDMQNKEIIYKSYINIGVAVDSERGLLVPVIKNVDQKDLTELSVELTDKAERTRNKKIKPDEMEGGNITISNLGGISGTYFTPIIYAPQVAILGVARSSYQPVATEDGVDTRLILPLTLTYDHRIIDGADGARFLKWIKQVLEDPFRSFLGETA
mgnify:CR=1 FL=1